jgi:hypothetical protein
MRRKVPAAFLTYLIGMFERFLWGVGHAENCIAP